MGSGIMIRSMLGAPVSALIIEHGTAEQGTASRRHPMGKKAISVSAAPAAKRGWWDFLRPDDPRYPRAKALSAVRSAARIGWLPITVYLGSAATNVVTALSTQGVAATMNLN